MYLLVSIIRFNFSIMKKNFLLSFLSLFVFCGVSFAQNTKYKREKIQHRFTYLTMNGEFKMDLKDLQTTNDERNPSRIILSTSEEKGTTTMMTFFEHNDENKIWAKCEYQWVGSRPDPHYFPHASKTSIWDVFEKVGNLQGDCDNFKVIISRSPHDTPLHMHLRYGDDVEKLLNMSKDEIDDLYNPWWAEYIPNEIK